MIEETKRFKKYNELKKGHAYYVIYNGSRNMEIILFKELNGKVILCESISCGEGELRYCRGAGRFIDKNDDMLYGNYPILFEDFPMEKWNEIKTIIENSKDKILDIIK